MKLIFKILITFLLASTIWLLCISCGARHVQKQSSKEETKTESVSAENAHTQTESNVKTETSIKVDDKNETVTEETTYKPEDPTKESFIIEKDGTKVILNNTTKTYKKTIQKNNTAVSSNTERTENKNIDSKQQKDVKQVNTYKKENSSKQVEKEAFNWFNMLWFLIPITIIYIFYRKYKNLTAF